MATAEQTKRIAIVCGTAFLLLNAAFYFLSDTYFNSHQQFVPGVGMASAYTPDAMMHIRIVFAVFSGVVAGVGFAAGLEPRLIGHLIPTVFGVANLVGSAAAFVNDAPAVVGMVLLVSGILYPLLAWHSYKRSRAAWAFLVAMLGVFAIVELFGAPKVRGALGISMWTAMIMPGLKVVAVAALIAVRGDYRESEGVTAATAAPTTIALPPTRAILLYLACGTAIMFLVSLGAIGMGAYSVAEVTGVIMVVLAGMTGATARHLIFSRIRPPTKPKS